MLSLVLSWCAASRSLLAPRVDVGRRPFFCAQLHASFNRSTAYGELRELFRWSGKIYLFGPAGVLGGVAGVAMARVVLLRVDGHSNTKISPCVEFFVRKLAEVARTSSLIGIGLATFYCLPYRCWIRE